MTDQSKLCQQALREAGTPYPRTCQQCGLGPCRRSIAAAEQADSNDPSGDTNCMRHSDAIDHRIRIGPTDI